MQAWIAAELRGRIFVWVASESHVLAAKQTGKKKKKVGEDKNCGRLEERLGVRILI